jgi:hypothetical protein
VGAIYNVIGGNISFGQYDPQTQNPLCPMDGSVCRPIGSSANSWRCISQGHLWTWGPNGLYLADAFPAAGKVASEYPNQVFDPSK